MPIVSINLSKRAYMVYADLASNRTASQIISRLIEKELDYDAPRGTADEVMTGSELLHQNRTLKMLLERAYRLVDGEEE